MRVHAFRQAVIWCVGKLPFDLQLDVGARALPESITLRTLSDLEEAERQLRFEADPHYALQPPELIVVWQDRPGEMGPPEMTRLRALAPLARIWRVLGPWCEGEQRSGHPPQGCATDYWHQFVPRFRQDLRALGEGRAPSWQLPDTAHPDERPLASRLRPFTQGSGLVVVVAGRSPSAEALDDACRQGGYETLIVSSDSHWQAEFAVAVVWDTCCEQLSREETVNDLRTRAGGAPLVAVVGFPRPEDVEHSSSIAAVVSKPYRIEDLLWQIAGQR